MSVDYKLRCLHCEGKMTPMGLTSVANVEGPVNKYSCTDCKKINIIFSHRGKMSQKVLTSTT